MRDIRQDLRERLGTLEARRGKLQAELKEIDDESAAVIRLLDFEDQRFPLEPDPNRAAPTSTLADFIFEEVGKRHLGKHEIRAVAERAGYFMGTDSPGRALHLTLVNMERSGRIRIGQEGKYEHGRQAPAAPDGLFRGAMRQ